MRALFEAHGQPLFRFLLGLSGGDRQLAEDLAQETLLRAWRSIESLNPDPATLRPWLFTVARRVAIDAARARRARPSATDDADVADLPVAADAIELMLTAQTVRAALARLNAIHRDVITELYYRGRTVAEAALRLGIPEGTVKSRAYHALRAMRSAIGAVHGES